MAEAAIERALVGRGEGSLAKARDDEPVFILRAQDKVAPFVVEYWAQCVANLASDEPLSDATKAKLKRANELVDEMRAWQRHYGAKVPD